MKNSKWIGLLLMLVLVFTLVPSAFAADTVEPFVDVPTNQYYADPVSWAVESKVTAGTDATHFSPAATCTRGQIVTFLYRAAGEPKTTAKNPFVDVKESDYYYNAVLWAVEQKVTAGTDATHFSPAQPCTRGQIVTFLYRAAGEPETKSTNPFKDVAKGAYYENAVLWAVANKITSGMSADTFGPGVACQRAHAVTFLYRYYHMAQPAYVLMNIPYADFYAADGVAKVDAVSSSTLNKTRTANLAGGSYHKDPKGTDISGIIYPVYVADVSLLDGLKEVKDSDSVTISVTNRGQTSESTFTGKEALFENEDYAYYMLSEEPSAYKTMTKDAEGKLAFSAVSEAAKSGKMTAELTYGGHHTDITFKVAADELDQASTKVNAVVITAGGEKYALRHVYEIWRVIELGWNWEELDGNGLGGKTITNVTYYVEDAEGKLSVLSYDVNVTLLKNPGEVTASFADASTVALTGLPADMQNAVATVKNQVGRGETATVYAENVAVKDGKIALTTPAVEGQKYVISITSANYGDVSCTAAFGNVG